MIRKKSNLLFFQIGQRFMMRRMFQTMKVNLTTIQEPCMVVVNHSSFYDSLVLFELFKRGYLPSNIVAGMSADGLKKFPLFKGIGTFPISKPIKVSEIKQMYALAKTNTITLFPQGVEEHQEKRPLTIQPGMDKIISKFPQHGILYISIYYSYTDGLKGEVACRMDYQPASKRTSIQEGMTYYLDCLKAQVIAKEEERFVRLW